MKIPFRLLNESTDIISHECRIPTYKLAEIIEQHCEEISAGQKGTSSGTGRGDALSPCLIIGVFGA